MSIANGHELLDKLENIDPALVAAADREPERAPRRRGGGIGAWIAVAACLCVLCLPLVLKQAFAPAAGPAEGGPLAAGTDTSHQVEGGAGEGGMEAGAGAETGETEAGQESPAPGVIVQAPEADDPEGWTKTYISQAYIDALPEGLSPQEMFSYNRADPEAPLLWNEYRVQGEVALDDGAVSTPQYWFDRLPDMREDGYTLGPLIWGSYDTDGSLAHVMVKWEDGPVDGGEIKQLLLLAGTEELGEDNWTPEEKLDYLQRCHETIITDQGVEFSVLGTAGSDKAISFWKDGYWFRVYGWKTADPEDMVKVTRWALDHFDPGLFSYEEGTRLVNLQEQPDAFAGYYPTDSRFVCVADSALLELKGEEPFLLGLEYGTESPLITVWAVQAQLLDAGMENENWVELTGLTWESLAQLDEETRQAYFESHNWAPREEDGAVLPLYLRWDGYYVTAYYRAGATVDDLWELVQYLQSGQVKEEKKIGDIVKLQPYSSASSAAEGE